MSIELVTTEGIFALGGGEWEVENNIWLVGDDKEVVIFDAAHDHQPIVGNPKDVFTRLTCIGDGVRDGLADRQLLHQDAGRQ